MFPRLNTVIAESARILGALAVIVPLFLAGWNYAASAADERAKAYIQQVVDQRFDELTAQVDQLNNSINQLIRGQSAETSQSEEEARINRQILCLQELQLDPSSGTVEECQSLR